jgi:hypothetical protein
MVDIVKNVVFRQHRVKAAGRAALGPVWAKRLTIPNLFFSRSQNQQLEVT